jgi:hypothetical protein
MLKAIKINKQGLIIIIKPIPIWTWNNAKPKSDGSDNLLNPCLLNQGINISYIILMRDRYHLHNINVDGNMVGPLKTFIHL